LKVLDVQHIVKSFESVQAVKGLSFSVEQGQVFGLLGPNGAGKTTTIRMIMQIILPDSGAIRIFDRPLEPSLTDRIGYMPEERGLYKKMKVIDAIVFFSEIKGADPATVRQEAKRWLVKLDLAEWAEKKVEELSKGMQQKIQFICTILHKPELIILDEPFTGLDPVNVNLLKDVMLELKNTGATIIFSTHQMEQVEKLCDAICLINKGEAVLHGPLSEVKAKFGKGRIQMRYEGKAAFLKDKSLVASCDDYGKYVEIAPAANATPQDILKQAVKEIFIQLVGEKGGAQ
jgi:ABC-2 type transport system ATP-binding protein